MDRTQRVVVVGVCLLTVVAFGFRLAGAPAGIVQTLELANTAVLFLVAVVVPTRFREQRAITLALGFVAVGDLFLSGPAPLSLEAAHGARISCSVAAYVALTIALLHGRPHSLELLFVLPFLGVGTVAVWALQAELTGALLLALPIYLLVVTVMAWSAATTLSRTHFVPRVRVWAALGGSILFAGEVAVAFQMLHPALPPASPVALRLFVRGCFIGGWLLMLLIACDRQLRTSHEPGEPRPGG